MPSSTLKRTITDPTILFTACVIILPIFALQLTIDATIQYLTTPMLWLSFVFLAVVVYLAHNLFGNSVTITDHEALIANWFLMNGVYFTLFFDVVSGLLQKMDALSVAYNYTECRYALGLHGDGGEAVFMCTMLELFFQSPLALLTYTAIHRKWGSRYVLIVITSLLHSVGVFFYYVPEVLQNFRHCDGWPLTWEEGLSFYRLIYFWFGFFFLGCGVWTVVPFLVARGAWRELVKAVEKGDKVKGA